MSQQQPAGEQASTPEMIKRVVSNAKLLANQDAALVKQQLSQTASHGGKAAGAGGAMAVMMLYVVGFLGLAGGYALQMWVYDWAAWLIVAGVFLLIALVSALIAKSQATKGAKASKVATTQIKEDVEWAKQQIKR